MAFAAEAHRAEGKVAKIEVKIKVKYNNINSQIDAKMVILLTI